MAKKTKAKAKASAKKTVKKAVKKPAAAAKSKASKAKVNVKPKLKAPFPNQNHVVEKPIKPDMTPAPLKNKTFIKRQKARLLDLRDHILDQMQGVAQDNLRSRAEGSEASAFGMHQADAGSDAYEKDFALSLLSQEQDALYEIEEALKRVDTGAYGICEMSGKPIPNARLEAIPFARFTVECQAQIERENRGRRRWDTAPQFMDSADSFVDEEDEPAEEDDKKKEKE
jgi:DnaK suppressor protein